MKIIGKSKSGYIVEASYEEIANIAGCSSSSQIGYKHEGYKDYLEYKFTELPIGAEIRVSEMFVSATETLNAYSTLKSNIKVISTSIQTLLAKMEPKETT